MPDCFHFLNFDPFACRIHVNEFLKIEIFQKGKRKEKKIKEKNNKIQRSVSVKIINEGKIDQNKQKVLASSLSN